MLPLLLKPIKKLMEDLHIDVVVAEIAAVAAAVVVVVVLTADSIVCNDTDAMADR